MRGAGFRKPASKPGSKEVGLAVISYDDDAVRCSCGWARVYISSPREKVIEDAIDRHLSKRHRGRGIRL